MPHDYFIDDKPQWADAPVRDGLVFVRLELQSMREQLMHAFHTRFIPELQATADKAMESALAGFNFEAHVMQEATAALREFTREVVRDAVRSVLDDDKLRADVQAEVATAAADLKQQITEAAIGALRNRLERPY